MSNWVGVPRIAGITLSILALGLAAGLAAGCGGGGTTTVTVTESSGSEDASEVQEQVEEELAEEEAGEEGEGASGDGECAEKEISTDAHKEGICTEDGTTWSVVNMGSTLKMETLEARLLDIKEQKSITDLGETATANGIYTSFEIEVTNLTHAPVELEESQVVLFLDESTYTQDFNVQNGFEQQSFLWQATPIQPQGSMTGTVTFDLPEKVVKKVTTDGNLDFVNFGTEIYGGEEFFEQDEVGTIRTYK